MPQNPKHIILLDVLSMWVNLHASSMNSHGFIEIRIVSEPLAFHLNNPRKFCSIVCWQERTPVAHSSTNIHHSSSIIIHHPSLGKRVLGWQGSKKMQVQTTVPPAVEVLMWQHSLKAKCSHGRKWARSVSPLTAKKHRCPSLGKVVGVALLVLSLFCFV